MDLTRVASRVAAVDPFSRSGKLDAAAAGKDLFDAADSTVMLQGQDESFLPFQNGFQLAVLAAGRPVWLVVPSGDGGDTGFFFVGTEAEAEARILAAPGDEQMTGEEAEAYWSKPRA